MNELRPYVLSLAIGLLVGIERQRAQDEDRLALGVRSFALLALLGTWASSFEAAWVGIVASVFAFALIALSYLSDLREGGRHKVEHETLSMTTEIAAGLVFLLGLGARSNPEMVSILGPLVAFLLFARTWLHGFTKKIKGNELQAALLLILIGVGVGHLLPDRTVDPWGLWNPKKFGILIFVLGIVEFTGYVANLVFGERRSSLLVGFLGGLVSSTAVTLSSAQEVRRDPKSWSRNLLRVLAAQAASILALVVVVGLVSWPLVEAVAPWLVATIGLLGLGIALLWKFGRDGGSPVEFRSPLNVRGVLRLAIVFTVILIGVGLIQRRFGDQASELVAFLTGLFELQGIGLAFASMVPQGEISLETARTSLSIAMMGSFVSKAGIGFSVGAGRFAVLLCASMLTLILAQAALLILV